MKFLKVLTINFVLFSSAFALLAGDKTPRSEDGFAGKILVVELEDRTGSYVLESASLQTIGKRMFLVGSTPAEPNRQQTSTPTVAIAWEKVEVLTIFENLAAFKGRQKMPARANLPIGFEIARLRDRLAQLGAEIHDHLHFIAKTEVEVEKLLRSEGDQDRVRRRKEQLVAIKKKLDGLISERRLIEVKFEELRHKEILQGRLID